MKKKPSRATGKRKASVRRAWSHIALRAVLWAALAWVVLTVSLVLPLRWLPPLSSSFMIQDQVQALWNDWEHMGIHYQWVRYDAISPYLGLAAVAAEDQKFPDHYGFDFGSIQQALADGAEGKPLRGASTISQQVAKNLYLWSGRSLFRKGLEAWLTLFIEALWPKQRILEVYLNIAEMGKHTYGAEAASRRFFGKSAAQLGPEEAALLAAVLPNPLHYRVDAPSAYVRERQSWILKQMRQLGGVAYLDTLR